MRTTFFNRPSSKLFARMCAFGLLLLAFNLKAQTYIPGGTMTGTPAAGSYYNSTGITLTNLHFIATSGNSLRIFISPCVPLLSALTSTQNYINTIVPRVPGFTNSDLLTALSTCQAIQTVQYMDGLGRPIQTVQVKGNPNASKDVIIPQAYDVFGREAIKYLSYTTSSNSSGAYRANALTSGHGQDSFYIHPPAGVTYIPTPYSVSVFEPSPLNRVTQQGAPGNAWQPYSGSITGSGHTVKMVYALNNDTTLTDFEHTRAVALYTAAINSNGSRTLTRASNTTIYAANQLTVTISKDENWTSGRAGTTEEYKDKEGHIVLKRTFNYKNSALEMLSTYYVYDDLDQLAFVLPPGAKPDSAWVPNTTMLNNMCYQYRYDERNRLTQKRIPGKGWNMVVYNKLDQPVLTQDSIQRASNQWEVTKYDAHGRVIMTGLWNAGIAISQATLQASIYAANQWDARDYASTTTGYSISSYPSTLSNVLTINYYDDYSIPNLPYDQHSSYSSMTHGLATATKTAILLPNDSVSTSMLWSVHYYDDKGRSVKSYQQHYLGATVSNSNYDEVATSYDFSNNPIATTRQHHTLAAGGAVTLAVTDSLVYDHMNRKVQSWSRINGGANVLLSKTDYNEVGQAYTKKLHSTNGNTFLQNVTYGYNERGWMQKDSAALFNMRLKYVDGTTPQYNGNISQMQYTGPNSGSKTFTYAYDKLNRLTNAAATGGTLNEALVYDVMGNIDTLTRGGQAYSKLTYAYSGNQLTGVTGSGFTTRSYAYDGNGNATSDGTGQAINYNLLNLPRTVGGSTATYVYDATGKKLRNTGSDGSWDYIDGIVYHNDTLSFVSTEEGRAKRDASNNYTYEYSLKDHLGNDRLSFYSNSGTPTVLQEDEYYSFGLRKNVFGLTNNNRYLYNGKEVQTDLANQYDYGARFYDPVIGRWTSVDPLVEAGQESGTPYGYVYDDPIKFNDPDGRAPDCCGAFLNAVGSRIASNFSNMGTAITHPINTAVAIATSKEAWKNSVLDGITMGGYSSGKSMLETYNSVSSAVDGDMTPLANQTGDVATTIIIGAATEGAGRGLTAVGGFVESQVGLAIQDATWTGPVDYTGFPEPRNVGPDKPFTKSQHTNILEHNKKMNNGVIRDDGDGSILNHPVQSKKGVKADMNQAELDHNNPRKPKDKTQQPGTNSNSNARVRSKRNNLDKSNN